MVVYMEPLGLVPVCMKASRIVLGNVFGCPSRRSPHFLRVGGFRVGERDDAKIVYLYRGLHRGDNAGSMRLVDLTMVLKY